MQFADGAVCRKEVEEITAASILLIDLEIFGYCNFGSA